MSTHTCTDCVSLSVADSGLVGWPNMLRDFSGGEMSKALTSSPMTPSQQPALATMATLTPNNPAVANNQAKQKLSKLKGGGAQLPSQQQQQQQPQDVGGGGVSATPPRLKRLNSAAQRNVYSMVPGSDGQPKFRCNACSRTFKLKCTLLRHVRHQHQGRFVPHPCRECGQVFKRTDHLKVHMRKIHGLNTSKFPDPESAPFAADSPDVQPGVEATPEPKGPSPVDLDANHPKPEPLAS